MPFLSSDTPLLAAGQFIASAVWPLNGKNHVYRLNQKPGFRRPTNEMCCFVPARFNFSLTAN